MKTVVLEGMTELKAQLNESIAKAIVEASVIFVSCNEGNVADFTKYKEEANKKRNIIQKAYDAFKRGMGKIADLFKSHQSLFEKYQSKIEWFLSNGDLTKMKAFEELQYKDLKIPNSEAVLKGLIGRDVKGIMDELDKAKTFDDFRIRAFAMFKALPKKYKDIYGMVRHMFYGNMKESVPDYLCDEVFKVKEVPLESFVKRTGDTTGNFLKFDISNMINNITSYDVLQDAYKFNNEKYNELYEYFVEMYHRFSARNDSEFVRASVIEFINIFDMIMGAYESILVTVYETVYYIADTRYNYINDYLKYFIKQADKAYVKAVNA